MSTVYTGWLVNEGKNKFAPKTLVSQVIDENGKPLETILAERYNYCECSTSKNITEKHISLDNFQYTFGVEVTVKFLNGSASSNPISLNINQTGAKPIYYKGKLASYLILEENSVYTFKYNGSAWEFVGDINKTCTLGDFGVTATYEEINNVKGTRSNIQEQIDFLNTSASNNFTDNGKVVKKADNENNQELTFTLDELCCDGIVTMEGYTTSDFGSAVWLKVNEIEVGKLQQNTEEGGSTNYYKCSFKVSRGDVVIGKASSNGILTFYPTV